MIPETLSSIAPFDWAAIGSAYPFLPSALVSLGTALHGLKTN